MPRGRVTPVSESISCKTMGKVILTVAVLVLAGLCCIRTSAAGPGNGNMARHIGTEDSGMKIAVMSDIHVMAPELLVEDGKAYGDYIAGDRKLLKESPEILRAAVSEILKMKPDVVLVSGDLTKDGEYVSHRLVSEELLKPLTDSGIRTFVIPGNHDVLNPHAVEYSGDSTRRVRTVTPEEFACMYRDFGYGQAIARDTASLSYVAQLSGNVRLLAIDACRYEDNDFGTGECIVGGRIKDGTMDFIAEQARKAEEDGCRMLTMIHHGVVRHWKWEEKAMSDYLVKDWRRCGRMFRKLGLQIVFSGHFHAQDIAVSGSGKSAVYDIETGSTVSYPMPVRSLVLDGDSLAVSTWHIAPLMADKSLEEKAVHYAGEAISSIVRALVGDSMPQDIVEEAAAVAGKAYVAHIGGDETMSSEDKAELKSVVAKVRKHSLKYAFILDHIVRYLHTDKDGIPDNNCVIRLY